MMTPVWERRSPGRLRYELDALKAAGVVPEIDLDWLDKGVLAFDFEWPVGDRRLKLRAIFPDDYPRIRPEVFAAELAAGRHIHPFNRNLCLLGRGTDKWRAEYTLVWLLEKLPDIFATAAAQDDSEAVRNEDQQGEPAEDWWNRTALSCPDSFCLIDSAWHVPEEHNHGTLTIRYVAKEASALRPPRLRAYVHAIKDAQGRTLLEWSGPLPADLRSKTTTMVVPWARALAAPIPDSEIPALGALAVSHPSFTKYGGQKLANATTFRATMRCILYRAELGHRSYGDGWLFLLLSVHQRTPKQPYTSVVRTFRAGLSDIGARVPAVASLREKKIAVFGIGAIGAPVAVELARHGCGELRLVEFDIVEPGNVVRWPIGMSACGDLKLEALASFLETEYPSTRITRMPGQIGASPPVHHPRFDELRSSALVERALHGADLVIDTTAELGVNWILNDACIELGLPLINAHATPSLAGGVVARFLRQEGEGCRMCLDHAWGDGTIPKPGGTDVDEDGLLVQMPGCNERTFTGAGFDLGEMSLEVVRLAVDTLSPTPSYPAGSRAHIVGFLGEDGSRIPPRWQAFSIRRHAACGCQSQR